MRPWIAFVAVPLLAASSVWAETIYKQRAPDGRITYSNKPLPGATVVPAQPEATAPTPPSEPSASAQYAEQAEARIRDRIATRELAWNELLAAEADFAEAQRRLSAASTVREGDTQAFSGPSGPSAPATGGALPSTSPAVGGPLNPGRGAGRSPEYFERVATLERAVEGAQRRLERAQRNYNEVR